MRLFKDLVGKFATGDQAGTFRPGLFAWHGGLSAWLLAASRIFPAGPSLPASWLAGSGLAMALMLWLGGLHRESRTGPGAPLRRMLACWALIALCRLEIEWITTAQPGVAPALWFGGALVLLAVISDLLITRLVPDRSTARPDAEGLRWSILLGLATWIYAPLYTHLPSGVGDAHWYKLMLADFVIQVRNTGLPVWAGQTEYAFNGAVMPLRMAPWFQHAGALVDWLSGRTLDFPAICNLELALNGLAGAFSAYFCFRTLLPRQPWSAVALAFIYAASPAILAPLSYGDQYMTFLTAPLLPVAGCALWRICERDKALDYLLLAAALAALWLAHPPIGLCLSFFSVLAGVARLLFRRKFRWRNAAIALAAFVCLGSLPFASVLSLGPTPGETPPLNSMAIEFNLNNYPDVFLPLTAALPDNEAGHAGRYYQPGLAALLLCAVGLGIFVWRPMLSAGIFLFLVAFIFALLLPIPGVNAFLWNHVPAAIMQVLNTWPIQRLVGIWACLMLIVGAGSLAGLAPARRPWWAAAGFWGLLLPLAVWTGWQGSFVNRRLRDTVTRSASWRNAYETHNLVLTRYSFNAFSSVPSYFSHGYIDPVLEHRLLRKDLTLLAANAESAVRHGPLPARDPDGAALLAHGTWRAVNDNRTTFYNLSPTLSLPARQHLALWLDPIEPGQAGWLQFFGQDLFREYILPDSGAGSMGRPTVRGFGTLPSSSRVISLFTRHPHESPLVINIAPEHTPAYTDFDFARYELWRYDPADLPVVVKSWSPYHLGANSPEPAYLETPRAWLPHYRARVNGHYVPGQRSPDGLVMFPVPAGVSDITVKYIPPLWLELSYWLALGGWAVVLGTGLVWLLIAPRSPADAPAPA